MSLQSSWLASTPSKRLRVGECLVDVPLREIVRADGARSRVTLKSIAVLLVLAEHAGNVVSRDCLLETVWAGTMPTMDVVTQAVASLRKALGEGEAPGYVETIPKTGYRLLATVEWLPDASTPLPRPAADPRLRWRVLATIAAGLALLATLSWSMAGWQDLSPSTSLSAPAQAAGPAEGSHTLLTSRPGWEVEPALSPDGSTVAYAMSVDGTGSMAIFVQSTQPTSPRQLTTPPPGYADGLPRWSPDGRQLMFARVDGNRVDSDVPCELRLSPASGGPERVVGSCDRFSGPRYDWLPDGSGIVAGLRPQEGKAAPLSILRLDSGAWEPMDYAIADGNVDFDPRFSSDGSRLGFRRNLTGSDIWVMPADGGDPQQLTHLSANIKGWDWLPGDRSLLLGLSGGVSRLVRHDIATGRSVMLSRVYAAGLDVSQRGGNVVFVIDEPGVAMFRYPLPLRDGAPPQPLFPSTGTDQLPSPSPDGRLLAFHSNRSRETRLWIGELDNPDRLRMVEGFAPISLHPPQWSQEGDRLLVVGEPTDPVERPGPRLYEVDVASGRARAIALEGIPYFAQFLPGGRLLAIVDLGSGKWSLRILDLATPGKVLAQMDDVGEARFDPDGEYLYFVRIEKPGLWCTRLDLAEPELLDGTQPAVYWVRRWVVLEGKPFTLLDSVPGCLSPWQPMGAGAGTHAGCLDPERGGLPNRALVPSSDGDWLYTSMETGEGNSDIGMLQLDELGIAARPKP